MVSPYCAKCLNTFTVGLSNMNDLQPTEAVGLPAGGVWVLIGRDLRVGIDVSIVAPVVAEALLELVPDGPSRL